MCARAAQSKVHLQPQSASIERRMGGHLSVSSRLPTGTASVSSFRLGLRPGFFGGPTNPHQRLHAAFWRWKCSLRRSPVNDGGIFCRREVLVGSGQFGLPHRLGAASGGSPSMVHRLNCAPRICDQNGAISLYELPSLH